MSVQSLKNHGNWTFYCQALDNSLNDLMIIFFLIILKYKILKTNVEINNLFYVQNIVLKIVKEHPEKTPGKGLLEFD